MPISSFSKRIVVLGAGITGLTAAWHLRRAGLVPIVVEQSQRVGGAIGAWRSDGWLHELGPNSLLEGSSDLAAFIEELGLGSRRIYAAEAAKQRYIVRGGRLVAMPTSPLSFLSTRLFSARAKLKLLGEPWRPRSAAGQDESVAEFVVRRLGREFLDYAINPFVGGVYAGDPTQLAVRHAFPKLYALEQEHGSLLRGALKRRNASGGPKGRIFSFQSGLDELPNAIARVLGPDALRLGATVLGIRRADDGAWEVDCEKGELSWSETCASLVLALPADALAALPFEGVAAADRLSVLRGIAHPPVASVFTGYKREDMPHPLDGFGVLVPEVEHGKILGTLFSSTLFPDRAPNGHVAFTTFVGGTRQPELLDCDDRMLESVVQGELTRLIGVRAPPACVHIQRWPRAIPQYTLGYQRFKDAIAAVEAGASGLFIGGNCRDGISLAYCIDSGRRLAAAAEGFVRSHQSRTASSE